jgi:hypothetical protein
MNNEWDEIKSLWQKAREEKQPSHRPALNELIALGEARKKSTMAAHYGNTLIMGITWIVLVFFFEYLYSFQTVLSNVGIALMIGGLGLRIVIEIFSTIRSKRIRVSDTAAQSLENTLSFYRFRKRIHGPVTFVIVALYIIGFYMLTPEFSRHIPQIWLVIMDVVGLIAAIVLIKVISKGVRQELRDLEKIVELQKTLESL